uniref:Uncharacterized protein n=1 Tax=Rhizophora mucronata TaxID=61149 RepID=A0A2P2Q5K9_RHIMU
MFCSRLVWDMFIKKNFTWDMVIKYCFLVLHFGVAVV